MVSVGIIGASGYTGAELLRLSRHPDLDVESRAPATPRPAGGGRPLPQPGRAPTRTWSSSASTPTGSPASTSSSSACPTAPRMALAPEPPREGRLPRRPRRRLPAEGRRRCTRGGTATSTTSPSCWPSSSTGCPSSSGADLKGARLIATPGCYVTAASLALAPLVRAGLIEPAGIIVDAAVRRVGRPAATKPHHLLHGRRGLHRLRPARPPAHARDRAGHSGPRCSSRPTWRR